jgi:hypothetical protein
MQILVVMVVDIVVFHTEECFSHWYTVRYNYVRGSYPVYSVSYLIRENNNNNKSHQDWKSQEEKLTAIFG